MKVYYILFCTKGNYGDYYSTTMAYTKNEAIRNALKGYDDDFSHIEEEFNKVRFKKFRERI